MKATLEFNMDDREGNFREHLYTKITIETSYEEGDVHKTIVTRSKYDLDKQEFADMLKDCLRGHGWSDGQINEMFNCDCEPRKI
jgi:hypothetical protein